METNQPKWTRYVVVFLITAVIFFTAFYVSNSLNDRRLEEIRAIESKIAIDILSSETQFSLLSERSCKEFGEAPVLSSELNSLASRLDFTESQLGSKNDQVIQLKRYYSLLQIKDQLLYKRLAEKCGTEPIFIIYLYSNEGDCPDCDKEGYVLTYLRETYPGLRVYSFDYNLDLSAIKTLLSIYKIHGEFPVLIVGEKTLYGFKTKEEIEKLLPASITASTTAKAADKTGTNTKGN